MRRFRVFLNGHPPEASPLAEILPAAQRQAIQRQYRSYLPASHWLPESPVVVWLTGPNGKVLPRGLEWTEEYELPLLASRRERPRLKKLFLAAAAAATVVMPLATKSAAAKGRQGEGPATLPPSVHDRSRQGTYDCGPPTAPLTVMPRRDNDTILPLIDSQGRPVQLGAFHSNVAGTPHSNTVTNHTNTPNPHSNVWSNHSNIPTYTIPHTNVVPGDFIF